MTSDSPPQLSEAQFDELAKRTADVLESRDGTLLSRRQALGAGVFGTGAFLGGYGFGQSGGGGGAGGTGTQTPAAEAESGTTSLGYTPPGEVQSAITAAYETNRRGLVRLDPTETYSLAEIQIPPYVTLDLNGAWVRPARDATVFEVAPAGQVCNGVVDVAGAEEQYSATALNFDNDYWNVGPGSDLMVGPDEPMHDILHDGADKVLRWRCRGPARNLLLNGPRNRDTTSVGMAFYTSNSGIAFQTLSDIFVFGFGTGFELACDSPELEDGYGFINGNAFDSLFFDQQTDTAIRLRGTDPDINANNFLNIQIQPDPRPGTNGTDTCVYVGTGEGNRFIGHVWDPQKISSNSLWFAAPSEENYGAGDENLFLVNEKGLSGLREKVRDDVGLERSGFIGHAEAVGL